jgi:hypothetical protein
VYGSAQLGQQLGLSFGTYLGRQIALGACRDDAADDDFERRPFRSTLAASQLPSAVDLRPWMTPIEDQGQLGSCTSNALAGALEYLVRRETGRAVDLSRLFIYYNQRLWDDYVREDGGGAIAVGVRAIVRLGVPTERSWPYDRNLFAVQPPEAVYREAEQFQASDWWSVPVDADAMRACLASGFPITFGTRCTESFMRAPSSGIISMPGASESADGRHGRHALLLVGYDDRRRMFVVRNSWGADWGDRGYCYMPYDYVLNREWTRSCWAIRLTERAELDPSQHAKIDPRTLPAAPPSAGAAASAGGVGAVVGAGAQMAISMLTGSTLLAGLAGGLVSGITPGIAQRVRGRDTGAVVGTDRSDAILSAMRAGGAKPAGLVRMPWDDGLDERAIAASGVEATARVTASASAEPRAADAPSAKPIAAPSAKPMVPPSPRPEAPILAAPVVAASTARAGPSPGIGGPSGHWAGPDRTPASVDMPSEIRAAWDANGGNTGPFGPFVPPVGAMTEGASTGTAARFAGGGIFFWSGAPSALALRASDHLYRYWLEHGAARSPFGWPSEGPITTPDGAARALACTHGAIFDHPRLGAHGVHGVLFSYWRSLGGLASGLGHPIEDQVSPDDPAAEQSVRFEHGVLRWTPEAGPTRG